MHTTRLLIEVEVQQHDNRTPQDAITMVTQNLQFPAVQSVKIVHVETKTPGTEFTPVVSRCHLN